MSRYRRDLVSVHFVRFHKLRGVYHSFRRTGIITPEILEGRFLLPRWSQSRRTLEWSGPYLEECETKLVKIPKKIFLQICRTAQVQPADMIYSLSNLSYLAGQKAQEGINWFFQSDKQAYILIKALQLYGRRNKAEQEKDKLIE